MIKSDHGECTIDGKGGEILLDLNHIFSTLLEEQPELLIAVTTAWSPIMETKIADTDEMLLKCLYKISNKLAKEFNDD